MLALDPSTNYSYIQLAPQEAISKEKETVIPQAFTPPAGAAPRPRPRPRNPPRSPPPPVWFGWPPRECWLCWRGGGRSPRSFRIPTLTRCLPFGPQSTRIPPFSELVVIARFAASRVVYSTKAHAFARYTSNCLIGPNLVSSALKASSVIGSTTPLKRKECNQMGCRICVKRQTVPLRRHAA